MKLFDDRLKILDIHFMVKGADLFLRKERKEMIENFP